MVQWRLLVCGAARPSWNMAVDEALLKRPGNPPTLRLYSWSPPAISLGYFQSAAPFEQYGVTLVRRITGGGAIYHDQDLTYSLTCELKHLPTTGRSATYHYINHILARAFNELGIALTPAPPAPPQRHALAGFCFDRLVGIDLSAAGRKLAGAAQRRLQGRLLQHGSIPLAANRLAAGAISVSELAGRKVDFAEMAQLLIRSFAREFQLTAGQLSPGEQEYALCLEHNKYATTQWNRGNLRGKCAYDAQS